MNPQDFIAQLPTGFSNIDRVLSLKTSEDIDSFTLDDFFQLINKVFSTENDYEGLVDYQNLNNVIAYLTLKFIPHINEFTKLARTKKHLTALRHLMNVHHSYFTQLLMNFFYMDQLVHLDEELLKILIRYEVKSIFELIIRSDLCVNSPTDSQKTLEILLTLAPKEFCQKLANAKGFLKFTRSFPSLAMQLFESVPDEINHLIADERQLAQLRDLSPELAEKIQGNKKENVKHETAQAESFSPFPPISRSNSSVAISNYSFFHPPQNQATPQYHLALYLETVAYMLAILALALFITSLFVYAAPFECAALALTILAMIVFPDNKPEKYELNF